MARGARRLMIKQDFSGTNTSWPFPEKKKKTFIVKSNVTAIILRCVIQCAPTHSRQLLIRGRETYSLAKQHTVWWHESKTKHTDKRCHTDYVNKTFLGRSKMNFLTAFLNQPLPKFTQQLQMPPEWSSIYFERPGLRHGENRLWKDKQEIKQKLLLKFSLFISWFQR